MVSLASSSSETFAPVDLIIGSIDVVAKQETLVSGQNLAENTVVGRITKGAATAEKVSGNGNGTISAVTLGYAAKVGVYVLTCTAASTNAGTFQVEDPDGNLLEPLTVGVAYTSSQINLTVSDGSTDWGAGAVINVTVAAGSLKLKKCALTATDGSQIPLGILVHAIDATSGDLPCQVYTGGEFNLAALVFDTTFDSDAKKLSAFDRTNISVKKLISSVG